MQKSNHCCVMQCWLLYISHSEAPNFTDPENISCLECVEKRSSGRIRRDRLVSLSYAVDRQQTQNPSHEPHFKTHSTNRYEKRISNNNFDSLTLASYQQHSSRQVYSCIEIIQNLIIVLTLQFNSSSRLRCKFNWIFYFLLELFTQHSIALLLNIANFNRYLNFCMLILYHRIM